MTTPIQPEPGQTENQQGFGRFMALLLQQKLLVFLASAILLVVGIGVAPFGWQQYLNQKGVQRLLLVERKTGFLGHHAACLHLASRDSG